MMLSGKWRWEKTQQGGGWIVFSKTILPYEIKLFSGSESDRVQSLSAVDRE